jgi:hypothetical protein
MTNGFTLQFSYEVTGSVAHNIPCVSECPVCHPETAPSENFAMFGLDAPK